MVRGQQNFFRRVEVLAMRRFRLGTIALLAVLFPADLSRGADPFRYPTAKHGRGEMRYVDGVPVLVVRGSPAEIGEQVGVLALRPAIGLTKQVDQFVKENGWERLYPLLLRTGNVLVPRFPADHKAELEAVAKSSGWSRDLLFFGSTIPDLRKLGGCSVLMVEPRQSATGGMLFGRNVDWPPIGPVADYLLVTVYHPDGKHAFASVGYPGMIGCASGMNDAGLTLADLTVNAAADDSPALDPTGIPYALALRRVLEECATLDEAERLMRSMKHTVQQNVAICDRKRTAVFEVTSKTLAVRPGESGVCACTNHFRTKPLATDLRCGRYATLLKNLPSEKLTVADVAKRMDAVNQGEWTLQTMIFECGVLRLHLAYGKGPATRKPLHTVDLKEFLATER
jgi:hypothetical protein